MGLETCRFDTERMIARPWHEKSADTAGYTGLVEIVRDMLSTAVTQFLPQDWQGEYNSARAQEWIEKRDKEGATLLIQDRGSLSPIGLVILYENVEDSQRIVVHLGFLISESSWGKGFASELIGGFVAWCRENGVYSVVGGVSKDNVASRRVLEKNGFVQKRASEDQSELFLELRV